MDRIPKSHGVASFFFNDTATTEIYTLSLHDALPISALARALLAFSSTSIRPPGRPCWRAGTLQDSAGCSPRSRSEEHTSELQSQSNLVCRLLLEKKYLASGQHLLLRFLPPN